MKKVYISINRFMLTHPFIKSCIHFLSLFCPHMIAIFYSLFLIKIYLEYKENLFFLLSKPIICLVLTTLFRLTINRDRPSEKYHFLCIDDKKRTGHSFPSIQIAVAVSIALTVLEFGPNMGLLLSTLAAIVTVCRIMVGAHYFSDAIASILIAYAIYLI